MSKGHQIHIIKSLFFLYVAKVNVVFSDANTPQNHTYTSYEDVNTIPYNNKPVVNFVS